MRSKAPSAVGHVDLEQQVNPENSAKRPARHAAAISEYSPQRPKFELYDRKLLSLLHNLAPLRLAEISIDCLLIADHWRRPRISKV
jgi:hypothetical protein